MASKPSAQHIITKKKCSSKSFDIKQKLEVLFPVKIKIMLFKFLLFGNQINWNH